MKKIFLSILSGLMSFGAATAADLDLMPFYSQDMSWSGASLSSTTATWTEAWGGVVFNLENKDYSSYNYAVIDFEQPTGAKLKFEAYYNDEQNASSATESDNGSDRIIMRLDDALKSKITKLALMAAKPTSVTISKAVLVDELTVDPLLFEGSVEVPDMKKIYFKLGADKFVGLKKGQTLTVNFTTGSLQQYASVDFYSNNVKLKCQETRSNTKKDGQFSIEATETSTIIADDADVASLMSYGLQIKGRNVTITRVTLADGIPEPENPEPENPESGDGILWTGTVDTGKWTNDVTVDAPKFASCKGGDKLVVFLSVNEGNDFGNIELNDQKYTKLAADGTSAELDSYGCVQPGVQSLTYTLTSADAALLSANGLRVKGANITISKIVLESTGNNENPGEDVALWTGTVDTGKWMNDITVDASKFAYCKGGDILKIRLSVNEGSDYGNIELDDQNYTKLDADGTSAQLDNYGCVQLDVNELSYIITNSDAELLKTNGLRVKGANITVTEIILIEGIPLPDDPEDPKENMDETQIWSGSVNCGQWKQTVTVPASAFASAAVGDKFKINLTINAGKGKGIVKVQDGNGVDLTVNGLGTNMDAAGNFKRGAKEAVYDIVETDLNRLKESGLIISGFAVTVTKVSLLTRITTFISEVDSDNSDEPVEYYNLNGMRVDNPTKGLYIRCQGNNVTKVYIK